MRGLGYGKIRWQDIEDQVENAVQGELLEIIRKAIERLLEGYRDELIRGRRYARGFRHKRWGYRIRKAIWTRWGVISGVRVPRIRNVALGREVQLLAERYVRYAGDIGFLLFWGYLGGLPLRRLRVWLRGWFGQTLAIGTISRIVRSVYEEFESMRRAELRRRRYAALVLDGIHVRIRKQGKRVLLVAIGVDWLGRYEVLDWGCAREESSEAWVRLLRRLRERGLEEVEAIVSDGAEGIASAVRWVFPGVSHQACLWHFAGEVRRRVPGAERDRFMRGFWRVFDVDDEVEARSEFQALWAKWHKRAPEALRHIQDNWPRLVVFFRFPERWRHRIRTVNLAEGLFKRARVFFRRHPGWESEEHAMRGFAVFLLGSTAYRHAHQHLFDRRSLSLPPPENFNTFY